ncbi:uncharacterized protein BDR25DRAFT_285829 [Lindgomyces ingoldianus]|uniref:Uncharacterized protein n=1 Tax=Lindgomyces ingoldianus TaxID=673940 RepID=A0ACB6QWA8_9PLEO|nr:uncharacterized protein BDR25DRAFT_285829 [Lindgomyces ingoldianus]KAF2471303.1 hypothetical protein BDR25DRAFT_285829 [Lindgomyces ingoldianus]
MLSLLGWKDILRPIRDGYRHVFPSPDTGPTPGERQKQRELDRLKGFTYFDTFQQLEDWAEAESDALQRANTPLLPRAPLAQQDRKKKKARVLLCHDYSGNYHDYEAVQGKGVDEESYSCEYLQFVDTFIYFSHKLACIPPPSWTNALHRNGVKVLGTLLIEPQTKEIGRLLTRGPAIGSPGEDLSFPMAQRLVDLARYCGFDGWLINIEKPFPRDVWDPKLLQAFLKYLRDNLGPERSVNALTEQNLSFSEACGSVLTNYSWKESNAYNTRSLVQERDMCLDDVFFGVDVWAQNATKLSRPRVTYPEKGGGGTNTGVAVAKLADIGLSVGIFAPAWSFEHFPGYGRTVERAVWDGYDLSDDLDCSCGDRSGRHPSNRGSPTTRSAAQYAAGSEMFFYTDFSRAFGRHEKSEQNSVHEGKALHSQLASQSILPYVSRSSVTDDQIGSSVNVLSQRLEDLPTHSQLVVEVGSTMPIGCATTGAYERWLPIFRLDMPANGFLQARIRCKYLLGARGASFYARSAKDFEFLPLQETEGVQWLEAPMSLGSDNSESNRLEEIGFYLKASPFGEDPVRVVEVMEIVIMPCSDFELPRYCIINAIRVEHRGAGETSHWRLCWACDGGIRAISSGLPYSEITGHCSHFLVHVSGLFVGRAYAPELILCPALVDSFIGQGAEVKVAAVGFDGRRLTERAVKLCIE